MPNNLNSLCGPFFRGGGGGCPRYHNRQIFLSRKEKEKEFFFQGSTLNRQHF